MCVCVCAREFSWVKVFREAKRKRFQERSKEGKWSCASQRNGARDERWREKERGREGEIEREREGGMIERERESEKEGGMDEREREKEREREGGMDERERKREGGRKRCGD